MNEQSIFINKGCHASLYRVLPDDGGLLLEAYPRLVEDFHVGGRPAIGSAYGARWNTSVVQSIEEIKPVPHTLDVMIRFTTANSKYALRLEPRFITYKERQA